MSLENKIKVLFKLGVSDPKIVCFVFMGQRKTDFKGDIVKNYINKERSLEHTESIRMVEKSWENNYKYVYIHFQT